MSREATIVAAIRQALYKNYGAKTYKLHGSAFTQAGAPDIIGCLPAVNNNGQGGGKLFCLEVKRPGGEAPFYHYTETAIQHLELRRWQAAGALVAVVRSVAEAEAVIGSFHQPLTPPLPRRREP